MLNIELFRLIVNAPDDGTKEWSSKLGKLWDKTEAQILIVFQNISELVHLFTLSVNLALRT